MKEIGGYFGLEQLISNEYHKGLISLNTARNALLYVLKSKEIRKVFIPDYLCDVISILLEKENYEFEYYKVNNDFLPIFNKNLSDDHYLYVVNYYGQLTNEKILAIRSQFKNIILDNTHSFFQKPAKGIDTIYSCRKFFGVPDGAYLSTDTELSEQINIDISKGRMSHLLGRFEGLASEYYSSFQKTDISFIKETLKYMSKLTHNILGAINYGKVRKTRNENYEFLMSSLSNTNKLKLIVPDGAFAYPFYIENGIEIRKKLAKKKIYIPTLWPNVLRDTSEKDVAHQYAANILPLPCDQRYNIEDMKVLVEEVLNCIN